MWISSVARVLCTPVVASATRTWVKMLDILQLGTKFPWCAPLRRIENGYQSLPVVECILCSFFVIIWGCSQSSFLKAVNNNNSATKLTQFIADVSGLPFLSARFSFEWDSSLTSAVKLSYYNLQIVAFLLCHGSFWVYNLIYVMLLVWTNPNWILAKDQLLSV